MKKFLFLTVTIVFFISNTFSQAIYYVSITGNDSNDGKTWATAKREIQSAIDIASAGDQVWVAEGIYYPTKHIPGLEGDERAKSFIIKDGVSLYGSFNGTEQVLSERIGTIRNTAVKTILSGNIDNVEDFWTFDNSGQWLITGNENNSYHVVWSDIVHDQTIIDGFEISGGNANGDQPICRSGGGVCAINQLSIWNSFITKNVALEDGGGCYIQDASFFFDCLISHNIAGRDGGGVMIDNGGFYNSIILNNIARRNGGGVASNKGSVDVDQSLISNNSSISGGGFYIIELLYNSKSRITFCTITNNESTGEQIAVEADDVDVPLYDCIVWNIGEAVKINSLIFVYHCAIGGIDYPNRESVNLGPSNSGNEPGQAYPEFVSPTSFTGIARNEQQLEELDNSNWKLQKSSACRNRGEKRGVYITDLDLDNQPRISDGLIDIGPYEYQSIESELPFVETFADCRDGSINQSDLLWMSTPSNWTVGMDPLYGDTAAVCYPDDDWSSSFYTCEIDALKSKKNIELCYDLHIVREDDSVISALDIDVLITGDIYAPIFSAYWKSFYKHRYDQDMSQQNYRHDLDKSGTTFMIRFTVPPGNKNRYRCYLKNIKVREKDDAGITPIANSNSLLRIYPNPATEFIHLDYSDMIKSEIYNSQGTKVMESAEKQIPISKLPTGIYMVIVESNSGKSVAKFMKQ